MKQPKYQIPEQRQNPGQLQLPADPASPNGSTSASASPPAQNSLAPVASAPGAPSQPSQPSPPASLAVQSQPSGQAARRQGLINKAMGTGYTPQTNVLDENKETVQGRVTNLLNEDSPLIQDARTRANQQMNARGLINSSMAVGEGEKAALSAALPIASQDANAALTVSQRNQADINAARQFGATASNQFGITKLQGQQAIEQQTLQGQQQASLQAQKAEIDKQLQSADAATREKLLGQQAVIDKQLQELRGGQAMEQQQLQGQQALQQQQLRGDQANQLAVLENQSKQLLQSNASAAQFFSQISASIGDIMKEPDIGVDQKNQLVQKQIELLRNGLAIIGGIGNLDLGGLLNFPKIEPPPTAAPPADQTEPPVVTYAPPDTNAVVANSG